MKYADLVGLGKVCTKIREFGDRFGHSVLEARSTVGTVSGGGFVIQRLRSEQSMTLVFVAFWR